MKRWYNRKPETMQDWLLLFAVAAALLAAVWYLPAIAAALRVLLGLATPFAGGLALAYVLDIPARWFAIHLFGGRRGPGILLAYLALFGTVAALVGLVVPQLVQSVGSFAAALPGYLENAQALLELVQANYGVDTTSLSELLLNSGSSVESFLSGLAPQLAQAAMGAAGQVVNGFLALAASVYLLCGKAELLHTARLALRTALPPRTAGNVLGVFAMANKTFSGYIGGQLVDAVLVGGETFVLMLLFGIPYAPLISVVVAVTNIVPMLGPYLGAVPGAALLLFSGQPVHALEFWSLFWWCSRWTETLLRRAFWAAPRAFPACGCWRLLWWAADCSAFRAWSSGCRYWGWRPTLPKRPCLGNRMGKKQNRAGKHSAEPVQHISPHCLHNVKILPLEKPPLDVTIKL